MAKVIGSIIFYSSDEMVYYYNSSAFLLALEDCFNKFGINGWRYEVLVDDLSLDYQVYKVLCNNFCCDPLPFEEYAAQRHV